MEAPAAATFHSPQPRATMPPTEIGNGGGCSQVRKIKKPWLRCWWPRRMRIVIPILLGDRRQIIVHPSRGAEVHDLQGADCRKPSL
jgi:hypothetical protein